MRRRHGPLRVTGFPVPIVAMLTDFVLKLVPRSLKLRTRGVACFVAWEPDMRCPLRGRFEVFGNSKPQDLAPEVSG